MSFREQAWFDKVHTEVDSKPTECTDKEALPYLKEIFEAPQSYWNGLNIRYAKALEHERTYPSDRDELGREMEIVNLHRDLWLKEGEKDCFLYKGFSAPSPILTFLYVYILRMRGAGIVDKNH